MSMIIIPRKHYTQPQGLVGLADAYSHPDAAAYIGGQRRLIGGEYGEYGESGSILSEPSIGGMGSRSATASSHIVAGRPNHGQPGRFVILAQFIALDTSMRYIQGTVSDGGNYIEDVRCNSTQAETQGVGRVAMQMRAQDTGGAQLHAATTDVVHGVGDVCTVAWLLETPNTYRCAVNGTLRPVVYSNSGPYAAPDSKIQWPLALLNRNVRGGHNAGTGVRLLCYARLPIGGLDIESLSANPWQIFKADPVRIYSFPSGTIVPTLSAASFAGRIPSVSLSY